MTNRQKEVQEYALSQEEQVIKALEVVYRQAAQDCAQSIRQLSTRTDLENLQSIVYQQQYQQAILSQLEGILDQLHSGEFTTIADYLTEVYQDGFIGNLYDLQGQGIPLALPISQDQVVEAVLTDSKLSETMYTRLGEDVNTLKLAVRAQVSRGIASGASWNQIAGELAGNMINSPFKTAQYNAQRIVRTEGHRIQQQSRMDSMAQAKAKGANVVKQWDSTQDGRTRPEHAKAHGQVRELEEDFDVGGEKLKAPGVGGSAWNVCNCRCQVLQIPRWALGEDELKQLQQQAEKNGLADASSYEEYKQRYLTAMNGTGIMTLSDAELDAITRYVSSEAYTLNEKLRNGEALTAEEQATVSDLDSALSKLPSYQGTVYRSLSDFGIEDVETFINANPVGEIIFSTAYTSSGTEVYDASFPIQYVIQSKNGKDLRFYNPEESEILFGRNTRFRITKIEGHTIYMEEVQ